jgi:hypothetical protein
VHGVRAAGELLKHVSVRVVSYVLGNWSQCVHVSGYMQHVCVVFEPPVSVQVLVQGIMCELWAAVVSCVWEVVHCGQHVVAVTPSSMCA